ncbi:SLIK3 protein, partial [Atractosteus spatula]|nr:SLIK3 protein [Atractosteus spatula]
MLFNSSVFYSAVNWLSFITSSGLQRRMLWITLLSTIALGWTTPIPLLEDSEEIDEPCFDPCYCEVKESLFHIHCDSKGFTNISQISQSWTRPFKLYLQRNSMRKLYFNSFLHLNNAVSINLGNNALQDIHAGAFNGLSALKRLYLHENKLEVFRNDTFMGLESLEYLQADYNVIKRIESGAFRNLNKLRVLILNDNLIPLLPNFLFRSVSLTHLDLRGNRLKHLPYRGTLEYIGRSLMEIQLEENPWNCICDIVQLKTWLERIPYTALVGEITCESPFHFHGKDLREIKRSELCPLLSDAEVEAIEYKTSDKQSRPTKRPRLPKMPPTPRTIYPEGAFINLPNLKSLYLNGNDIEKLSPGMFRGLQSLRYLYFEYNVIREIQPAAFSLMPSLQLVFLNDNLLRTLPADAFAGTSLARLNLRNNYFLYLPVSGVLEHLNSIVQIDLHQNPWDCTCDIIPLKLWMEKLSSVIVVGEVICKTPEFVFGKDLRSLDAELLCPELKYSAPSPALPEDMISTSNSGLGFSPTRGAIPLSVLILSLLILFISAVFVAAGLFAFVLRRRKKLPFRKRQEVDLTGIQMQCRMFEDRQNASPEKAPGHVYDYIPHPVTQMCNNPIYKPREGEIEEQFAETKENNTNYRTLIEKEKEWTMALSTSKLNTIVAINQSGEMGGFHENGVLCPTVTDRERPAPTVGFVDCLYGTVPKLKDLHAHPPGMQYPDLQQDARLKETLLFTTGKGLPDQTQSEYLELRAKLQTKPDYLEVLEKSTYRF